MKNKFFLIDKLVEKLNLQRRDKVKIGLSHGVFDLLHLGHIKHFKEAKKNCDLLIVSANSKSG